MCGRYVLRTPADEVARLLGATLGASFGPRWNVAPSQPVPVVRVVDGLRRIDLLRWGLVPRWAKDPAIGNRLVNARSETAAEKPSFREALRRRRCLVPADGFYEWAPIPGTKRKQAWRIGLTAGELFTLAGLWERWSPPGIEPIESVTLLTMSANEAIAPVHDRMPVIVRVDDRDRWLDPAPADPASLASLMRPWPSEETSLLAVGPRVNDPRNDDPTCWDPPAA